MKQLLLLFLAALSVPLVAEPTDALAEGERARMSPGLVSQYESGAQSLRVIVHVAAASDASMPLSPRGVEQPRARLDAVRQAEDSAQRRFATKAAQTDLEVIHRSRLRPTIAVRVSRDGLRRLLEDPTVRFLEEDVLFHAKVAEGVPLIHADAVQSAGYTGEGVSVAIVDTGVDYMHPTLGAAAIGVNTKVLYGLDTANNDSDPMDCEGHGTSVASVAAGRPYAWTSVTRFAGGVAPDAGILAYKASPDTNCGSFYSSDVAEAVDDAVLQRDTYNVVAINLSIGGTTHFDGPCDGRSASYELAINDATVAGIAVVVAAGNEASKTGISAPACLSRAISVGSVYDAHVGGIAYCGDDPSNCEPYLCQDSNVSAKVVTCYSNSSPYLDLFAPSELLTTALKGGTLDGNFGGTSGASPYVTGAVALLYDAFGNAMDPMKARLLLELTGEPITDHAAGVTRPLVDVEAAAGDTEIALGTGTPALIPDLATTPLVSTTEIGDEGFLDSARVLVRIVHGRPEQLLVTLTAPDGTTVRLHDHGLGLTPSDSSDYLLGVNGLYVVYPDERQPAQSLDLLGGTPIQGTWTLTIADDDPTTAPGATPTLLGWALQLTRLGAQPPSPSASSFYIPVAAHAAGANETFWVSDVRIFNPSPKDNALVALYLMPSGENGRTAFEVTTFSIPAVTVLDLPDVVGNRFGETEMQGNLLFQTDAEGLVATSRTYNTGGADGTYGQFIGQTSATAAVGIVDAPLVIPQLASNSSYRSNLGVSEVAGFQATVTVTLVDGNSAQAIGSPHQLSVQPFSNLQVNRVFEVADAGESDNAYARVAVTGGSGKVVAYGSVVDNLTGDAIFVPGRHADSAASWVIPIAAKLGGQAGTNWVTDLRVYNGGTTTATLRLEYRPEQGSTGTQHTTTLTVESANVLASDDVLATLFDLDSASGSLRLTPLGGTARLLVTSRTYNVTAEGTYGQMIPAATQGFTAADFSAVIHLDKGADFRSNIGICEMSGGTAEMRYVLKSATGATLGVGSMSLGPYQVNQVNDVYGAVGAAEEPNTRVEFIMDSGTGSFTAYASVVDNRSGDAIFIPAAGY